MRPGVAFADAAEARELKRIRLLEQENEVLRPSSCLSVSGELEVGLVPKMSFPAPTA